MIRYYIDEFLDGDIDELLDTLKIYFTEYYGKIATLEDFLDL